MLHIVLSPPFFPFWFLSLISSLAHSIILSYFLPLISLLWYPGDFPKIRKPIINSKRSWRFSYTGRSIVLSSYLGQDFRITSTLRLFPLFAPSLQSGSSLLLCFLYYPLVLIRAYDCVTKSAYIASCQSGYLTATQAPRWGRSRPRPEHRVPAQNDRATTGLGSYDDYAGPSCHDHATLDQVWFVGCGQTPAALAYVRISSKEAVQVVTRWGRLDHRTAWQWYEVGGYQQTTPRPQCHQLPSSLSELPGTPKWMGWR